MGVANFIISSVVWLAKNIFELVSNAVTSDLGIYAIAELIARHNPELGDFQRRQLHESLRRVVVAVRAGRTEAALRAVGGIIALAAPTQTGAGRSDCGPGARGGRGGRGGRTGAGSSSSGGSSSNVNAADVEDFVALANQVVALLFRQGGEQAPPRPPPWAAPAPSAPPAPSSSSSSSAPASVPSAPPATPEMLEQWRRASAAAAPAGSRPSGGAADEVASLDALLVSQFGMARDAVDRLPDVIKPALVRALSDSAGGDGPTCCITLDTLLTPQGRLTPDVAALAQPRTGAGFSVDSPDAWHVFLFRNSALQDWFRSSRQGPRNPVTRDSVHERQVLKLS